MMKITIDNNAVVTIDDFGVVFETQIFGAAADDWCAGCHTDGVKYSLLYAAMMDVTMVKKGLRKAMKKAVHHDRL